MGLIVAIDGPAGAGKSTVARLVAQELGFALVDTGALYRCVALEALRRAVDAGDEPRLGALASGLTIGFRHDAQGNNRVQSNGEDVTDAIRTPEVSRMTSLIAALPAVRGALLELQRRLGREASAGAVLEGRDIGTVVFPAAHVKIYLTADPRERARRRFDELVARGVQTTYEAVLEDQVVRDHDDATREVAPLKPALDAVRVDTSGAPVDEVVARIVGLVRARTTHA